MTDYVLLDDKDPLEERKARRQRVLYDLRREWYLILCEKYSFPPDCSTTNDWIADLIIDMDHDGLNKLEEFITEKIKNG